MYTQYTKDQHFKHIKIVSIFEACDTEKTGHKYFFYQVDVWRIGVAAFDFVADRPKNEYVWVKHVWACTEFVKCE